MALGNQSAVAHVVSHGLVFDRERMAGLAAGYASRSSARRVASEAVVWSDGFAAFGASPAQHIIDRTAVALEDKPLGRGM